jgi:hypothetical protein
MRIEAVGPNDVFAVGGDVGVDWVNLQSPWVRGVLLHFDGTSWKEITTLPSDVIQYTGVSGKDGAVYVVGQASQSSVKKGVRCVSTDLQSWDCVYSSVNAVDLAVWTPRIGAALATGQVEEMGAQQPGDGRVAVSSLSIWGSEATGPDLVRTLRGVPGQAQETVLMGAQNGLWSCTDQ